MSTAFCVAYFAGGALEISIPFKMISNMTSSQLSVIVIVTVLIKNEAFKLCLKLCSSRFTKGKAENKLNLFRNIVTKFCTFNSHIL